MTVRAFPGAPRPLSSFSTLLLSTSTVKQHPPCQHSRRRQFSSTPTREITKLRSQMFHWLDTRGRNFQYPVEKDTNYLTDYDKDGFRKEEESEPWSFEESQGAVDSNGSARKPEPRHPFPLNENFASQPILSEQLREEIWKRVKVDNKSVRIVSVELGVEMRRVGAVVRLVELEKQWRAENKFLALPYAEAIHSMLHTTPLTDPPKPHESINDLPVHRMTLPQLFYPASESRQFNRADAGRVFSGAPRLPDDADAGQGGESVEAWKDNAVEIVGRPGHERPVLKAADARIPHPHLIAYEKDKLDDDLDATQKNERYHARLRDEEEQRAERKEALQRAKERHTTRVDTGRYEFLIKDCSTTRVGTGLDGRGTRSPGMRYGVPSQDRKRGAMKIPKRVSV